VGLCPDNPGAAPDTELGNQHPCNLDRPASDPVWDDAERVFADCRQIIGRLREQTARGLSLIATLYLREEHRWTEFLAARGVMVPRYGPRPSSQFHSVCRHFLSVSAGGDRTGYAGKLAAVLDEWHRCRDRIRPEQIPSWIDERGGIESIYHSTRHAAAHDGEDETAYQKAGFRTNDAGMSAAVNRRPEPRYYAIDEDETTQHWYSPPYLFDFLECEFDLDPASPGQSKVPWIPAREHYTFGGLERPWHGFVWLNPPYGRQVLPLWLEKFVQHGNGIALVPERTSTKWWQETASRGDLLLCVNQKIAFVNSGRDDTTACAIGSSLIGIGKQGVEGLITASRNGLGLLLVPYAR
jgi:DNA N-6-adenine-methyltransferase (Dam)